MEHFFIKKEPGKLDMVVGIIAGLVLFFAYRVGLETGVRWPYILLLLISVLVLISSANDKEVFMKICSIITVFYSVVSLIKPDFVEKCFVFAFVGRLLAGAFGIFVAFFGFLIGAFWRWIIGGVIYGVYYSLTAPKRRKLPPTKSTVRKDKWIYLHEDYNDKQTQLIYRKGKKKRILDTYSWENDDNRPHYTIAWNGEKCVTIEKYSLKTFKKEEEKTYEIK